MSPFSVGGGGNDRSIPSFTSNSTTQKKQGNFCSFLNESSAQNARPATSKSPITHQSNEKRFCAENSPAVTVGVYSDHLKVSFDGVSIRVDDFCDSLVHHLNSQRIPPFLEMALFSNALRSGATLSNSAFVEGDVEVEIVDYRVSAGSGNCSAKPVLLKPSSCTVIEDLGVLDGFLSAWNPNYLKSSTLDNQNALLEIEKRILTHTSKPLILDTSGNCNEFMRI